VWDGVIANFTPGHHDSYVNFHNNGRAPLLLIAGEEDHLEPLAVQRATARRYEKSAAVTELKQFAGRSHYIIGQPGWEEVADYALSWATDHAVADPAEAPEAVEA
jgi:dienelactone hydrolase